MCHLPQHCQILVSKKAISLKQKGQKRPQRIFYYKYPFQCIFVSNFQHSAGFLKKLLLDYSYLNYFLRIITQVVNVDF